MAQHLELPPGACPIHARDARGEPRFIGYRLGDRIVLRDIRRGGELDVDPAAFVDPAQSGQAWLDFQRETGMDPRQATDWFNLMARAARTAQAALDQILSGPGGPDNTEPPNGNCTRPT